MARPSSEPIRNVDEALALSAEELVSRLRPVIRRAFMAPAETLARHEENVPVAVIELCRTWQGGDRNIDGREVRFDEYLAVKLAARLREHDARQHPELYDSHRRYVPSAAADSLDANLEPDAEGRAKPLPAALVTSGSAEPPKHPVERLTAALEAAKVDAASQPHVLRAVAGVGASEIVTPRQFSKALGNESYRTHPATAAFIEAQRVLDRGAPPGSPQAFRFDKNL